MKFRAGWNDHELVAVRMAKLAEDCGLQAVALHPRTREQGYSGKADWTRIAEVKAAVNIPVIGNGDIVTPGRCGAHGARDRLRRRHDRPHRFFESLDLPPDCRSIWKPERTNSPTERRRYDIMRDLLRDAVRARRAGRRRAK